VEYWLVPNCHGRNAPLGSPVTPPRVGVDGNWCFQRRCQRRTGGRWTLIGRGFIVDSKAAHRSAKRPFPGYAIRSMVANAVAKCSRAISAS